MRLNGGRGVLIVVTVVSGAACGGSSRPQSAEDVYRDRLAAGCHASTFGGAWSSVSDVARASTVAIVTVVDEQRVAPSREDAGGVGPGEPMHVNRVVTLRFEDVMSGGVDSGELSLEMFGWCEHPDRDPVALIVDRTYPVVGDRLLVLLGGLPNGEQSLLGSNAMLFLRNGRVVDTPRGGPVFDELEGISEAELVDRLKAAL